MDEFVTREEFNRLEERVAAVESASRNQAIWQAKYGERIDSIYKIVEDLSSKPQKRWDTVVASAISAIVGGLVVAMLKNM